MKDSRVVHIELLARQVILPYLTISSIDCAPCCVLHLNICCRGLLLLGTASLQIGCLRLLALALAEAENLDKELDQKALNVAAGDDGVSQLRVILVDLQVSAV